MLFLGLPPIRHVHARALTSRALARPATGRSPHHCSESGYDTDYKFEDHVKMCLAKEEIDWLWNHGKYGQEDGGHCKTKDGKPHLGPEGLLVCTSSAPVATTCAGCNYGALARAAERW